MACGLPVVCGEPSNRADPDAARWLRGVAIDLSDPDGSARRCADAIDALDLSPADRDAMARYAAQHYDWEKMARAVMELAGHVD
jgi:glycosyltransferase involved in cell wall biosynthesis